AVHSRELRPMLTSSLVTTGRISLRFSSKYFRDWMSWSLVCRRGFVRRSALRPGTQARTSRIVGSRSKTALANGQTGTSSTPDLRAQSTAAKVSLRAMPLLFALHGQLWCGHGGSGGVNLAKPQGGPAANVACSGVTDADDELAHRLVLLHGGVRLLDLLQLVNLMNRHRESSGGDRVEVALKHGLRQVAGVAAVAGETHAAGAVADGIGVPPDPLVRDHPGGADGAVDPGGP